MKIVFDKSVEVSYGVFVCPICNIRFYGGGKAQHENRCTAQGYTGVNLHFGGNQVVAIIKRSMDRGPDEKFYGISLNMLREQCPDLLGDGEHLTAAALRCGL